MPRPKNQTRRQQLQCARSARKSAHTDIDVDDHELEPCKKIKISEASSASSLKLHLMDSHNAASDQILTSIQGQCWAMAHTLQLTTLISDLICPECFDNKLTVGIREKENAGFAALLTLTCSCGYEKITFSSPRVNNSEKENVPFEINPKMVLFSHEIGKSHTALDTFSAVVGIPNMHLTTYQSHDKRLSGKQYLYSFCNDWAMNKMMMVRMKRGIIIIIIIRQAHYK